MEMELQSQSSPGWCRLKERGQGREGRNRPRALGTVAGLLLLPGELAGAYPDRVPAPGN